MVKQSTIDRRERHLIASIRKQEAEWNKEIKAFLDKGMSFNDAWIAAGGSIIPTTLSPLDAKRRP